MLLVSTRVLSKQVFDTQRSCVHRLLSENKKHLINSLYLYFPWRHLIFPLKLLHYSISSKSGVQCMIEGCTKTMLWHMWSCGGFLYVIVIFVLLITGEAVFLTLAAFW